jgi:hypothetical protein
MAGWALGVMPNLNVDWPNTNFHTLPFLPNNSFKSVKSECGENKL